MLLIFATVASMLLMMGGLAISRAADPGSQCAPLLDDGVMIRVPVRTADQTLYFQVDTGFTVSALDAGYRPGLGDAIASLRGASPLGTAGTLPVYHCPDLSIAGQPLALDEILCLDLQMARWVSGQPCDGILGADFFHQQVVSLDFDHHEFTLSQTVPEKVKHTSVVVPLEPSAEYYSVSAQVNHGPRLELMVDTGDTSSLSLNPEGWRAVFGEDTTGQLAATVGDATSQVAASKIGVIRRLTIGGLVYTNLHATFLPNPAHPSHLGLGFFRRHNVTFDYPHHRLYLCPRPDVSEPDQEDMSGLHLLRADGETRVYSVDDHSPADADGIRPDDVIAAVDGRSAAAMTMRDIRLRLQTRDGDKVALQVRRGESVFATVLVLKQEL